MTTQEYKHYLEYWKIPLLEAYIEKLEEAFGNKLSEIAIAFGSVDSVILEIK